MSKLTSNLYSGAATIGKVRAIVGAVIMGIIVLIMIIASHYMYNKASTYSDTQTNATATMNDNSLCDFTYTVNSGKITINNTDCPIPFTPSSTDIKSMNTVVYLNKSNTKLFSLTSPDDYRKTARILLIISIILIIITSLLTYFTFRYKPVAALGGVETGADLIFH